MKSAIPSGCGLADELILVPGLMPQVDGEPFITDVQYDALAAGIAKGDSVLVSAPTSTGKTLIGWWAIASAVLAGRRAVYLVSHRALAKQKFEEAQRLFLGNILNNDRASLVCATGDTVEDASGRKTSAPLSASILVATYERFLGCLSTGGPPRDLTDLTFVCDEVQLIGDKTRGQNAELLLTLMKRAGWSQFVALSAVLANSDAENLADWLGLKLVRNPTREKALRIQCRMPTGTLEVVAGPNVDGEITKISVSSERTTNGIVAGLHKRAESKPTIVFCMKIDDTYDLSTSWTLGKPATRTVTVPAGLDLDSSLLKALERGAAFHNAELSEDERLFVEGRIAAGDVDVVYATSTLAAGVNFPFGTAVFSSWKRWNGDKKAHEPIDRAEFQNMAGRVGRMGQAASEGIVIFCADAGTNTNVATKIMDMRTQDALGHGIKPDDFGALALQVFAGKLCHSREDAFDLLSSTLSASRELQRNSAGVSHWKSFLDKQIDRLINTGCIIESRTKIFVTHFGLSVASSGLKPETAIYFIGGLLEYSEQLIDLLYSAENSMAEDDLVFILAHAALTSPEFGTSGGKSTRHIPWRISSPNLVSNDYAKRLKDLLFEKPWEADVGAANGALLIASWAAGRSRVDLERLVAKVRLGNIQAISNDAAWILTGVSDIVSRITSPNMADESKPEFLRGESAAITAARQLARGLRRQASRIASGLPTDILWMNGIDLPGKPRRLSRTQILSLRDHGFTRPNELMSGAEEIEKRRRKALDADLDPKLSNQVRDAAKRWKIADRSHCYNLHLKRGARVSGEDIVNNLYKVRGDDFEDVFQQTMEYLSIQCERLDKKGRSGYPDFLISIEDFQPIVVELKTRVADTDIIALNAATEVLSASELIGMRDHPCLTVCSPGVEASVPGLIERCGRLCVVDVCDLAEAVLRVKEGRLPRGELHNWLTTPGIALMEDLPHPH